MMWNHRFIQFKSDFLGPDDSYIELCEVYYDDNGVPMSYSKPHLIFDSPEETKVFVERIRLAANKPLLSESDFPKWEDTDDPWFCGPETED